MTKNHKRPRMEKINQDYKQEKQEQEKFRQDIQLNRDVAPLSLKCTIELLDFVYVS